MDEREYFFEEAYAAMHNNDIERAYEFFKRGFMQGFTLQHIVNFVEILIQKDALEEALEFVNIYEEPAKKMNEGIFNYAKAKIYIAKKEFDTAEKLLLKAKKKGFKTQYLYLALGTIYCEKAEYENPEFMEKAVEYLLKYGELSKNVIDAYDRIAVSYARIEENDEAEKWTVKAYEETQNADTTKSLGYILCLNGKYDEGIKYMEKGMEMSGNDVNALIFLSDICYYEMHDYKRSKKYALKAIEIDMEKIKAWKVLAFCWIRLNNIDEAVNCLAFIMYHDPEAYEDLKVLDEYELIKDNELLKELEAEE